MLSAGMALVVGLGFGLAVQKTEAAGVCDTDALEVCAEQVQHLYDQSMMPVVRDTINKQDHAMSFAMGNIPDAGGKYSVGMGAGSFGGENALAFGMKAHPYPNMTFSFSAATANFSDFSEALGMGAGMSWRF